MLSKQTVRSRLKLFNLSLALSFFLGLFAWLLVHLQLVGPLSHINGLNWIEPLEEIFGSDGDWPISCYLLFGLQWLNYLIAYIFSFSRQATARPHRRLLALHAITALAFAYGLPVLGNLFGIPMILVMLLIVAAWAAMISGLEKLTGTMLASMANMAYQNEMYGFSNFLLSKGILLQPTNRELRRLLGYACYERGDTVSTIRIFSDLITTFPDDMRLTKALEECYSTEKKWAKAQELNVILLGNDPEDLDLRMHMARVFIHLDRKNDAIALLQEKMPVKKIKYIELLLQLLLETNQLDEAANVIPEIEKTERGPYPRTQKFYESILAINPDHIPALEGLATLLMRGKGKKQSAELFERVIAADSQRHDIRAKLIQYYQDNDLLEQAEPHLNALIDAGQTNQDVDLLYGDILLQREDYDAALQHFHYAVERYPDDYRFPYFLAQISFRTEALDEATEWVEETALIANTKESKSRVKTLRNQIADAMIGRDMAVWQERCNRNPKDLELRFELIEKMARHQLADRVVAEYEELMEIEPTLQERIVKQLQGFVEESKEPQFRLLDYLADMKLLQEKWDEALELAHLLAERSRDSEALLTEHCQRILRRNPEHLPSIECLGQRMIACEDWQSVLEIYEKLRQLQPDNEMQYLETLFRALTELKLDERAAELGNELVRKRPHDIDLRLRLVHLHLSQGRYDEAFTQLQAAQSTDYYHPEVVNLIGSVAEKRRTGRIEELDELRKKDEDNFEFYLELGDLYVESGEIKKSITNYQQAQADPEQKDLAGAKLARSLARLRMFDLAEESLSAVTLTNEKNSDQKQIKAMFYDVAEMCENENENTLALKFFKEVFRVDASYRKVVDKVEALS